MNQTTQSACEENSTLVEIEQHITGLNEAAERWIIKPSIICNFQKIMKISVMKTRRITWTGSRTVQGTDEKRVKIFGRKTRNETEA